MCSTQKRQKTIKNDATVFPNLKIWREFSEKKIERKEKGEIENFQVFCGEIIVNGKSCTIFLEDPKNVWMYIV